MNKSSTPRRGRVAAGTVTVPAPSMLAATLGRPGPAPAGVTTVTAPPPSAPSSRPRPDAAAWTRGTTPGSLKAPTPGTRAYEVAPGDSLFKIARTYGVKVSEILRLNEMPSNAVVRPGQTIALPEQRPEAERPGTTHRVRAGETLDGIAERYGTTTEALRHANAMGSSLLIREGELLHLSGTGATSTRDSLPADEDLPHLPDSFHGRRYPAATVLAARKNKKTLLGGPLPTRDESKVAVRATAVRLGVPPALALAVAQQESGFNMAVVSPANAIGTMQVCPSSGRWASSLVGHHLNILDPADNVVAGVAILRALLAAATSESEAIAGYFQGLASVRNKGMYDDTRKYVRNIHVLKARFASNAPARDEGSEST